MSEIKPCQEELPIGYVQAHCSDGEGIADVGVYLRLDDEQAVWCGEITREHAEEYEVDDAGWWLVWEIGKMREPIARVADDYRFRDFVDAIAAIIRDRDRASEACASVQRERDEAVIVLRRLVQSVDELISESAGVYGLHLNGDPAPWEELTVAGKYEEWLIELECSRAFLSRYEGEVK